MGQTAKRLFIILLILTSTFTIFGQGIRCNKNYLVEKTDSNGCVYFELSLHQFSYYFQVEKQFKLQNDTLPHTRRLLKELERKADSLEENFTLTIEMVSSTHTIMERSITECETAALETEFELYQAWEDLDRWNTKKWWYVGLSAVGTFIITKKL